ncbi:MAG: NUDIX domain-containing protein [Bacteroidota bacterium]
MDVQEILESGAKHFLPNLSIDIVIIGYQDDQLKCLLLNLGGRWSLSGGYIRKHESVEVAAERILMERTRLRDQHLKFLSVAGDGKRQFSQEFKTAIEQRGLEWKEDYWVNNRFVSLIYYALVDINETFPEPGDLGGEPAWFDMDDLPEMWMDHESIVQTARKHLQEEIRRQPITANLLPVHFTMPQLHKLHQTILDEKLDRSRFQKKMLATGKFERLPKLKKESPGSNPYQYRLKDKIA